MIIGLHGKMKSGKGEATSVICSSFGYIELRFAQALKDMTATLLGVDPMDLEDQKFKETEVPWIGGGVTPRKLMQTLGTEWGRNIDKDLWVKKTLSQAALYDKVVISDVRFENELYAIQDAGGIVIRIKRPMKRVGPEHEHVSETALDHISDAEFNHTIDNEGTLSQFISKVYNIMDSIRY